MSTVQQVSPSQVLACTFDGCGRVFAKGFELRKHLATHENPASVFHCTYCDFITLSKKRLSIHVAVHTGEKAHVCPDTMLVDGVHILCDYKTHDPAALSKHRKRVHGYVPPANRSRPKTTTPAPPKPTENNPAQRRTRSDCPTPATRRRRTRSPRKANARPAGVATPANPIDVDAMDVDGDDQEPDYDLTAIDSDEEMYLDPHYDPSLRPQWLARFEESYTTFDLTGSNRIESVPEVMDPILIPVHTDREGCLCPEWMVEAGVEGWDDSVLSDLNKEQYIIQA